MGATELLMQFDPSRLSARERILAVMTILTALLAYLGYVLVPMSREVRSLEAQRITLASEIDQGLAQIPVLKRRHEELYQSVEAGEVTRELSAKAGDLLPGGSRLSSVLEELTRLARLRRIEFVSVRPEAIEDKGTYLQLTLQIDTQSRFRELGEYLLMLENLPRAVIVKDLKVEGLSQDGPSVLSHLKTMTYLGKE